MNLPRLTALLGLLAAAAAGLRGQTAPEREHNYWPIFVEQTNAAGERTSWTGAGPLLFEKPAPAGGTSSGFRPVWVQTKAVDGNFRQVLFLYPLFSYQATPETYSWSFFELIKRSGRKKGAPPPPSALEKGETFDIWPFWFSKETGDPETSSHGFFPIYGTIKSRLGFQELHWVLFPFYAKSTRHGTSTTYTPWPFIRVIRGENHGWAFWPFYGKEVEPTGTRRTFFFLGYNNVIQPNADAKPGTPPSRQFAVMPFYTKEESQGFVNVNILWPFFGYTDRTSPVRYHEVRYFWPFLVKGEGDERNVTRYGPFYTHSNHSGTDKTWYMWPLYRETKWDELGLHQTKRTFFWFLYWSQEQRSATNPNLAPAYKTHVWPFVTIWDNGAGRHQVQALSPFEVFFQDNDKMRQVWTPIVALYRYDRQGPGQSRGSILWNGITWEHSATDDRHELHVGPLLRMQEQGDSASWSFAGGLLGAQRSPAGRSLKVLWFDFPAKTATAAPAGR